MSEWTKAAEVQLELHHWLTSEGGSRWARHWVEAEKRSDPKKGDMYDLLQRAEPYKLFTASPIWVSPDMCDVVDAAREGFRPERLEREDFIVPNGFLYFAKPLYLLDRNRTKVSVGAIAWCPSRFASSTSPEGEPLDESGTVIGLTNTDLGTDDTRWGMSISLYSSANAIEDTFSKTHQRIMREYGNCELFPLHYTVVEFGDMLDEGHLIDEYGSYTGADQWWKLIQTTLRLMQQRIAVRSDATPSRPTRRRYERAKMPVSDVLVIHLRRRATKSAEPGEKHVEWTHRWIVDAFWRNQWYESLKRHRQIWIAPHVKGPESLPLIVRKKAYKWDR